MERSNDTPTLIKYEHFTNLVSYGPYFIHDSQNRNNNNVICGAQQNKNKNEFFICNTKEWIQISFLFNYTIDYNIIFVCLFGFLYLREVGVGSHQRFNPISLKLRHKVNQN